jgi:hypothetical protein
MLVSNCCGTGTIGDHQWRSVRLRPYLCRAQWRRPRSPGRPHRFRLHRGFRSSPITNHKTQSGLAHAGYHALLFRTVLGGIGSSGLSRVYRADQAAKTIAMRAAHKRAERIAKKTIGRGRSSGSLLASRYSLEARRVSPTQVSWKRKGLPVLNAIALGPRHPRSQSGRQCPGVRPHDLASVADGAKPH